MDQSFSIALPIQTLRGLPCRGSFSVFLTDQAHRGAPAGVLLRKSARQTLKGAPWVGPALQFCASGVWWASLSVVQLPMLACGEREAVMMAPTLCVTQQYCLASTAARLSSTGISHHNLLPHILSSCLSTVNSSPRPGVAPQPLNSSSQLLLLSEDLCPSPGCVRLRQGLSESHPI